MCFILNLSLCANVRLLSEHKSVVQNRDQIRTSNLSDMSHLVRSQNLPISNGSSALQCGQVIVVPPASFAGTCTSPLYCSVVSALWKL